MCKQQSYRFTRLKQRKKESNISSSKLATAICVKATARFPKWSWEARHSPKGLQEDFSFWISFLEVVFYFPDSQMFLSSKILRDFIFLFPHFSKRITNSPICSFLLHFMFVTSKRYSKTVFKSYSRSGQSFNCFKKQGFGPNLLHIKSQTGDYLTLSVLLPLWARFCESCFNNHKGTNMKVHTDKDFTEASVCPGRLFQNFKRYTEVTYTCAGCR